MYQMAKKALEVCNRRFVKMEEYVDDLRSMGTRVAKLEPDARQPRLAMEADEFANTKTRERKEGAVKAVQAMHGDSFSARRVIEHSIHAVLKVVSAPACFWNGGACCFVVRLYVLEGLGEAAAVFGGSMIRDSKACKSSMGEIIRRLYSGQFAGSLKLGRL